MRIKEANVKGSGPARPVRGSSSFGERGRVGSVRVRNMDEGGVDEAARQLDATARPAGNARGKRREATSHGPTDQVTQWNNTRAQLGEGRTPASGKCRTERAAEAIRG